MVDKNQYCLPISVKFFQKSTHFSKFVENILQKDYIFTAFGNMASVDKKLELLETVYTISLGIYKENVFFGLCPEGVAENKMLFTNMFSAHSLHILKILYSYI